MKNICFVFGTRPEVIKLAPVILELKKYPNKYKVILCNTEQQKELSNQTLSFFGLVADFCLNVMRPNQTLAEVQSRILLKLADVYKNNEIDATIVQGDTMSVFCGALTSFYNKVPVFHVEAGLRSYDKFEPFPEESIRQMVSRIADLHFVPTNKAFYALKKENIAQDKIYLTGNTVIDALSCLSEHSLIKAEQSLNKRDIDLADKIVLVTAHRRENHGERLSKIIVAIKELSKKFSDYKFVIPVHPNPNVKNIFYKEFDRTKNVILTDPLDYPELVLIMQKSKLILTDSGGIQEEAPTFGIPLLVMRYETERMEGVEAGFAKLVGADTFKIINCAEKILNQKEEMHLNIPNPYGDGKASERIESVIGKYFYE